MAKNTSVVFVLLPVAAKTDVHSTLCSVGDVTSAPPVIQLITYGVVMAQRQRPFKARVWAHAAFGENGEERVARINSVELFGMRMMFEWLANSKWGYEPHITEQPGAPLPPVGTEIAFDRLGLWYGDARWAWTLGAGVLTRSS